MQYQAGDSVLVAAPRSWVLLPRSAAPELVDAAWTLAESGAGPLELLTLLGSALPTGAAGAVAGERPSGWVVFLSGSAQAVVGGSRVSADPAQPWTEHRVGINAALEVVAPGRVVGEGELAPETLPASGRWLPIRSGAVLAGAVRVLPATGGGPAVGAGRAADPGWPGPGAPSEELEDDEYGWIFRATAPPPGVEGVAQEADTAAAAPPVTPIGPDQGRAATPPPALDAGAERVSAAQPQGAGVAQHLGDPSSPAPQRPQPPAVEPPRTQPPASPPEPPASVPPPLPTPSPAAGSRHRVVERPLVDVVDCPSGHANAPTSTWCRVCRRAIRSTTVRTVPRPTIGYLRLVSSSPGAPALIPLDADRILGRGPRRAEELGCIPVVIGTPGVDLSRDHLQVSLVGWHVVVTDLGSLNGTTVSPTGGAAALLLAGEPREIDLGSLVTLADVVTYRFEASA